MVRPLGPSVKRSGLSLAWDACHKLIARGTDPMVLLPNPNPDRQRSAEEEALAVVVVPRIPVLCSCRCSGRGQKTHCNG